MNKHKLNIHYRGSLWGSRTQQHANCLRYAHSHHTESYLGKKQPQAKIAIAFLFGQLHFNNVTLHALFYGGHLVLRSKRCAVQNQGITLNYAKPVACKKASKNKFARLVERERPTNFKHHVQRWCNQITMWCKSLPLEKYISYRMKWFFSPPFCLFLPSCFYLGATAKTGNKKLTGC